MNRHSQHLQLGGDAREHLDGGVKLEAFTIRASAALVERVQQHGNGLGPRPLGLNDHQKALPVACDVVSGCAFNLEQLPGRANLQ